MPAVLAPSLQLFLEETHSVRSFTFPGIVVPEW